MLNTKPIQKKENYDDYGYYNNHKHSSSEHKSHHSHHSHDKHDKHDNQDSNSNSHSNSHSHNHKNTSSVNDKHKHSSNSNRDKNVSRPENRINQPLFKLESNNNKSETPDNYKNNISNVVERKNYTTNVSGGGFNETNNTNNTNEIINVTNGIYRIEYTKELDTFSIYENNQLDCTFSLSDVLKYIFNPDEPSYAIKKYIFIITINLQQGVNEFNFINSIFTSDLDCMIKLQNYIYESISHLESLDVEQVETHKSLLIIFYFQIIIFLFRNMPVYESNTSLLKISKIFSGFVFRFSSLILRNIMQIQTSCEENTILLNNLTNIKDDLTKQLFSINQLTKSNNFNNNASDSLISTSSNTNTNTNSNSNSQSRTLTESDTESDKTSSEDLLKKYKIKDKNGIPVNNFVDLFSDQNLANINISDSDNGYQEFGLNDSMNDTVSSLKMKTKNFKPIKDIETSNINSISNITGSGSGTTYTGTGTSYSGTTGTGVSYNINSALDNGQVYKLKI